MVPRIVDRFNGDEILAHHRRGISRREVGSRPSTHTRPAPFEGAGEVPMMSVEGSFEHADDAIRLPYGDGELRFVAMLGDWHERGRGARAGHRRAAALHAPPPSSS